ncbi:MAG: ATP-binding protein [Bacteroidales bacterium]|nr:ATP-binding protein [Bacteroidales bacterium]NLO49538.1 4Fe-4S binding protein [Bacteroidales bacterium]
MKPEEITILSGKGGTGKTSVTAAFASLAEEAVFCDCDVDAADLHLLLKPDIQSTHPFVSGSKAIIDPALCSGCGLCAEVCRFDAVLQNGDNTFYIDPMLCEGCRLCSRLCPEKAIHIEDSLNNFWYISSTRFGTLVHAHMTPGEENSGKLVATIRDKAREIAKENNIRQIINDGPPGIGCPVIASLSGVHKVLLVAEPSVSGLHDALRLGELTQKFGIPTRAIINKWDLNPELSRKLEEELNAQSIEVIGKIPFDRIFTDAMIVGQTITEFAPEAEATLLLKDIWKRLVVRNER